MILRNLPPKPTCSLEWNKMTKWSSCLGGQPLGNLSVACLTRYQAFLELRGSLSARIKSTEYAKELGNFFLIFLFSHWQSPPAQRYTERIQTTAQSPSYVRAHPGVVREACNYTEHVCYSAMAILPPGESVRFQRAKMKSQIIFPL